MMQIKTVIKALDDVVQFDDEVNSYLLRGWTLKRRYVSVGSANSHRVLVAELSKGGFTSLCRE